MNNNEIEETPEKDITQSVRSLHPEEYFKAVGHLSILDNIKRDVAERVPVIVVTGEDGCGKSVLGEMLTSEPVSDCVHVYFDKTVESFEDVVAVIASKIDVEILDITRSGITTAIGEIAVGIERRGLRLLLVCDGAERIFLATLERIRKMLERVNSENVYMQVVFIGRKSLLDNLQQLRICNFKEVPEKNYILEPLSFSGTSSYLEFLGAQLPEADAALLTPESVDKIYQRSNGNFKKIDNLVQELCNRHGTDASFWVLLENVEGGMAKAGSQLQRHWRSLLDPKSYSPRVLTIGTIAVVLCLLLYLFSGGDEKGPDASVEIVENEVAIEPGLNVVSSSESDAISQTGLNKLADTIPEKQSNISELPPVSELLPSTEPSISNFELSGGEGPLESLGAEPALSEETEDMRVELMEQAEANKDRLRTEELLAEAQEAVDAVKAAEGETAKSLIANEINESVSGARLVQPIIQPANVKKKVIPPIPVEKHNVENADSTAAVVSSAVESGSDVHRILGDGEKKKVLAPPVSLVPSIKSKQPVGTQMQGHTAQVAPALQQKKQGPAVVQAKSKKIPVLNQVILPEKAASADAGGYAERVAAGRSWLTGSNNDTKYTIQLMALSSENAAQNISGILAGDEYAGKVQNIFIFEKSGEPSTIFLFLGEYTSMEKAQEAMGRLPESFRRNEPYILSVKNAVQKVQ